MSKLGIEFFFIMFFGYCQCGSIFWGPLLGLTEWAVLNLGLYILQTKSEAKNCDGKAFDADHY